jgi:hypothetical protein
MNIHVQIAHPKFICLRETTNQGEGDVTWWC